MKKLFIQFYLLLFVCFLVMSLLVGLVYKFTAERAGKQSLDDLMNSSLYLMRSELREIPPHDWGVRHQPASCSLRHWITATQGIGSTPRIEGRVDFILPAHSAAAL